VGGQWPQTTDSNRLTVDLGDVEPRARLQQAIEVEEEIALALELEVDSVVGEDARANPLLKLAGQNRNGDKLAGSPNQTKAYDGTSHHRRWYSEPFDMLGCQRSTGATPLERRRGSLLGRPFRAIRSK
jgi:hypothetical protein